MPRPVETEFPPYYANYISYVAGNDVREALQQQQPIFDNFFESISQGKQEYAYAPGKWTLKELLQHVIDAERVFNYRALSIARGEKQALPGFDENEYAANSFANQRNWQDLIQELKSVRASTRFLFNSFPDQVLSNIGNANGSPVNVNALGFIIVGHVYHHIKIVKERYL